ncbi:Uncharacterised protein [Corynebacterium pilosum]|uniref:Uncharacterized protein n=1 Tax=Corynebacterium pilosum TaxID=35756 RepID=A0A376CNA6_9CORY|nr:Uncharacterised protein [Corynebacterium pilosum]
MGNPPRTTTPAERIASQTAALGVKSRNSTGPGFSETQPDPDS